MIRILHVVGEMNMGGIETFLVNLHKKIDKNKIQFDYLVHTNKECFYDNEIKTLGGIIHHAPRFDTTNFFKCIKFYKKFFQSHPEYRIIHGHFGHAAAIYLHFAKKAGCYTIAHSHSTKTKDRTAEAFVFSILSYPTRFIADYFFGCSKQAGIDRFGTKVANSNKFSTVMGIDTKKFLFSEENRKQIRKNYNIKDEDIVVYHVGRFVQSKNHTFLLQIFKKIIEQNTNSSLWLFGDGPIQTKIKEQTNKLGISDKVKFFGIRNDINIFYNAADIFILPSTFEGLGLVCWEAQLNGLPCLVSDVLPEEAKIDNNLYYKLSLKKPAEQWATIAIQIIKNRQKINEKNKFPNIDMINLATWITEFYYSKLK